MTFLEGYFFYQSTGMALIQSKKLFYFHGRNPTNE